MKTLEEPPAHVKFIFATTEIRKVPVTVLSRCQRFDLRRIEPEDMIALMRKIAAGEGAEITDDALALITRAAEGSARDATSLLDQAIIARRGRNHRRSGARHAGAGRSRAGAGPVRYDPARRCRRRAGRTGRQYADGADPMAVLRDLAEITHWISVVKITPDAAEDPTINPDERVRGVQMAEDLPMRALTRMWQMLLKALDEVAAAPNAMMAAEMAVIRLTHVADLPSPEDLVRKLQNTPVPPAPAPAPAGGGAPVTGAAPVSRRGPDTCHSNHRRPVIRRWRRSGRGPCPAGRRGAGPLSQL